MRFALASSAFALLLGGLAPQGGAAQIVAAAPGAQVRVTTRMVVVDTDAFTRAGLSWVVLGTDQVTVRQSGRRTAGGAGVQVGTHRAGAFLEAVRASRWVRSESSQQVLAMSGAEAMISSTTLTLDRRSARTRGPTLAVIPTVLEDGRLHLRISARVEDAVTYPWGYGVDGSPAAVETELIVVPGQEIIVGSSSATERTRDTGVLWWGAREQGRDVLVAVTAHVIGR